jgi:hypothetical protein
LDKKLFFLTIKVLRIFSSKKRGTKSSYNPNKKLFDKPIRGVNVIGSPEGSVQAVQPEFNSLILFFIGIR